MFSGRRGYGGFDNTSSTWRWIACGGEGRSANIAGLRGRRQGYELDPTQPIAGTVTADGLCDEGNACFTLAITGGQFSVQLTPAAPAVEPRCSLTICWEASAAVSGT